MGAGNDSKLYILIYPLMQFIIIQLTSGNSVSRKCEQVPE